MKFNIPYDFMYASLDLIIEVNTNAYIVHKEFN